MAANAEVQAPVTAMREGAVVGRVHESEIIDYFSDVLKRGRLERVEFNSETYVSLPRLELEDGLLPEAEAAKLFAAHDKGARRQQDESIQVAISLVSLAKRGGGQTGLLLLAATLQRDGRLSAALEVGSSPWIPAERLSSESATDLEVMVGSRRAYSTWARLKAGPDISRVDTFADALGVADRMFTAVSGKKPYAFAEATGAGRLDIESCYIAEYDRIFAVAPLIDVYDAIRREPLVPGAGRALLGSAETTHPARLHEQTIHDGDGLFESAMRSCGSMSDEYPMADSQRRALHGFLMGGEGDVTAVNGPPGTGKTTMLQAIVANLFTRCALERTDPPVIVGTSTNNQAVTNIIASFGSVTKDAAGALDSRWLPKEADGEADPEVSLRSLAVYCPAQGRLEEAREQYLVEQRDRGETYSAYSRDSYLAGATPRFVASAARLFGGMHEPATIKEWIHQALIEIDELRCDLLRVMYAEGPSAQYRSLCERAEATVTLRAIDGIDALTQCSTLIELDRKLDTTLRYAEFWLAVHYFEVQWLLTDDFLDAETQWRHTAQVSPTYWRQAAALTPCFVMTMYQVPRYFDLRGKPGEPTEYDFGRIDLLIVDEAGQVDTPLGVPAFALAKRALVVGDERQLPPIWSLDETTDCEVAEGAGITAASWNENLRPRGLTCSETSSLMRAASYASQWSYGDGAHGIFLSEHYRCHPDIIGYCNELLYDGLLRPQRKPEQSKLSTLTPAFLWWTVPGSEDKPRGSSRVNQIEAEAIAAWIIEHFCAYLDIYNKQVEDPNKRMADDELIGVVTPFRAQADLIRQTIRRSAEQAKNEGRIDGLPDQLWNLITVGTAHRLQGAERPIVLFSAAYGRNSPTAGFIDRNPELMNVAVSRAKDLFVVFAAEERWNNGPVFSAMSAYARRGDAQVVGPHGQALDDFREPQPIAAVEVRSAQPEQRSGICSAETAREPSATNLPVVLSAMLEKWRAKGVLSVDDEGLTAKDLNPRLAAAGVLEGEPGTWRPGRLASLIGVVSERRGEPGKEYDWIGYTPQMQDLLLKLYRDGHL